MQRIFGAPGFAVLLSLGLGAPASAATFQGRSVDDHRYHGSVTNNDYGRYDNVEVKFQGERAYVYLPAGGRLILNLEDEDIVDPHTISGHDPRRGIQWEIDLKDLHSR